MLFRLKRGRNSDMQAYGRIYLALQTLLILLWWLGLYLYPEMCPHFFPLRVIEDGLFNWFAADLIAVVIPLSVAACVARARPRLAVLAGTGAFGGLSYAGVQCLFWAFNDGPQLSAVLMLLAMAGTLFAMLAIAKRA